MPPAPSTPAEPSTDVFAAPGAARRRVLFIATDFPPLAGTNTQRIQSFVRHLPAHGWEPWVVTRAVEDLPLIDPAELEWPEARERVIRVPDPDPFAALARRRGRGAASVRGAEAPVRAGNAVPVQPGRSALVSIARWPVDAASSALKTTLRFATYHPDALRPWANAAARVAAREAARIGAQVIVSSHPAYSTHMAGLAVKRATRLPWVADFRDLWVDRPYRSQASRLHAWVDRHCEAAVVAACDRIVVASPAWVDRLVARYGEALRAKAVVITNGYEREPARSLTSISWRADARLKLAWTGAMFESESPTALVEALGRIRATTADLIAGLEVRLAGYGGEHEQAVRARAVELGLGATLVFMGPQPHEVATALQTSADGLLLALGPGHRETLQGKMFEYMARGKPILAIHPEGGVGAAMLARAGLAEVVPYGDVDSIETTLRRWLAQGPPAVEPDWKYISQYDRAALAGRLAGVLDEVAAERGLSATLAEAAA